MNVTEKATDFFIEAGKAFFLLLTFIYAYAHASPMRAVPHVVIFALMYAFGGYLHREWTRTRKKPKGKMDINISHLDRSARLYIGTEDPLEKYPWDGVPRAGDTIYSTRHPGVVFEVRASDKEFIK